ncbi:Alpha/Beta hydrolase protein [Melanogaster broomeanus]|nr:Alpha/Beta hydrolase protein [Melanogaster broomeanus]
MSVVPLLEQDIHIVPSFTLENGSVLRDVPVAYKTWGHLNESRDNVMIICHAFTGSADVEDWWGPLMGRGKAFDSHRFFIFCANVLGSPYSTASPITTNPDTGKPLHKLVLDHLGISRVAVAIVRHIIPIATSARHSAWCISWGETQRQCIYSDPMYADGYYVAQPSSGLAAARMAALLTYRSPNSFESRFGRRPQALLAHNEGHKTASRTHSQSQTPDSPSSSHSSASPNSPGAISPVSSPPPAPPPVFSAQSYLRYQGAKFVARFDANCYIHITRKMDTHDVARAAPPPHPQAQSAALAAVLATLPHRALVISIETDGLFTPTEQRELATHIPEAELVGIPSPDGHDGFLLEFEQINTHVLRFLKREFPEYYEREGEGDGEEMPLEDFAVKKTSLFGEAEADVTRW